MILIILSCFLSILLGVEISPEQASFSNFMKKYDIVYESKEQQDKRERIFNINVQKLRKLDCQSCGITKFTATTQEQMDQIQNLRLPEHIQELAKNNNKLKLSSDNNILTSDPLPSSLDWRQKGVISPVKAQGTCGTCWSFTTVAMCQSALILKGSGWNSKLYSTKLSQQYLLKCTSGSSCNGGYLQNAIDKALQRGLPYENQFPYQPYQTRNNGVCSTNDLVQISNQTRKSKYYIDDQEIIQMLQAGPLAIAISATGWQNYKSGLFKCSKNAKINHAVLLVGYTPTSWIVKNSWGQNFGDEGFMYVSRKKDQNCGIGVAVHSLSQMHIGHLIIFIFMIFYLI